MSNKYIMTTEAFFMKDNKEREEMKHRLEKTYQDKYKYFYVIYNGKQFGNPTITTRYSSQSPHIEYFELAIKDKFHIEIHNTSSKIPVVSIYKASDVVITEESIAILKDVLNTIQQSLAEYKDYKLSIDNLLEVIDTLKDNKDYINTDVQIYI